MIEETLHNRHAGAARPGKSRCRPCSIMWLLSCVVLLATMLCSPTFGQVDSEILPILADMIKKRSSFQPAALNAMGVEGLVGVLDELLPETAKPKEVSVDEDAIAELISHLGSATFRTRETASERLESLGPSIEAQLLEAAKHADAEIAWRARRILHRWKARRKEDKGRYAQAFAVYARGIDDHPRLTEITRRIELALESAPPSGSRGTIIQACITAVVSGDDPEQTKYVGQLMKHENPQIASLTVRAVGMAVTAEFCPQLLLDALRSDQTSTVQMALAYVQKCKDSPRREEIKEVLVSLFEDAEPSLKLRVALPLIYVFDYPAARDFLLVEAQSTNRSRQYQALSYLGSHSNRGKPADKQLLDVLVPIVKESKDNNVRRLAARALGIHTGKEVVESLIPLLVDSYSSIPRDVTNSLLQQPDKKMVRRLLSEAAKDESNTRLKAAAAAMLKKLPKE